MTKPILQLKNATVQVTQPDETKKTILPQMNLTINKGDFVVVLGTNGAGKSTLFNVINGTQRLAAGQILLNGHDITTVAHHRRAAFIAQVFQDPKMGTAPRMSVAENLLLATKRGQRRTLGLRKLNQQRAHFQAITAQLPNGLSERLTTPAGALSGGQRQTLSFLMATQVAPQLLLLDEHTAALDPKTATQLMELTATTVARKQLTCLMITHDLAAATKYGNRLIILNQGKIVLDVAGAAKQALTPNQLLDYFTN